MAPVTGTAYPNAPWLTGYRLERGKQVSILFHESGVELVVRVLGVGEIVEHFLSIEKDDGEEAQADQTVVPQIGYGNSVEKNDHFDLLIV